jgi:hypothetical protein
MEIRVHAGTVQVQVGEMKDKFEEEEKNKLVGEPVVATNTGEGEVSNTAQSEESWQQGVMGEDSVVTEKKATTDANLQQMQGKVIKGKVIKGRVMQGKVLQGLENPYLVEVTDEEHHLVEGKEIIDQQAVMVLISNKYHLRPRG